MPEKATVERARRDARQGKSPSTQAGEFVREEMHHVREGKHGARSTKQAIAIGLSKARRAGVKLAPPKKGRARARTRKQAARDYRKGQHRHASAPSSTRSRAVLRALKREQHGARVAPRPRTSCEAGRAQADTSRAESSGEARGAHAPAAPPVATNPVSRHAERRGGTPDRWGHRPSGGFTL